MKYNPEKHHRRSIRLKGYDYSQAGAYFVTICTQNRACLFGEVVGGDLRLNDAGTIARQCWLEIPIHFPNTELDEFVIMPNHVHGIIVLVEPPTRSIPTIIGSFKSATTKRINEYRSTPGTPVWQRSYYEHVIRDDESLNRIQKYIRNNPVKWTLDRENSSSRSTACRTPTRSPLLGTRQGLLRENPVAISLL